MGKESALRYALAVSVLVGVGSLAFASGGGDWNPLTPQLLIQADTNHDTQVTFDELKVLFPALTQNMFDEIDDNDDGVLTVADLPDGPPPGEGGDPIEILTRLLRDADANHDHQLTLDEIHALYPGFPGSAFLSLDRNHDGVLTEADLPATPSDDPIERFLHLLHDADTNNDGQVTLEEAQALHPLLTPEVFDTIDRNGDGVLSSDDLPPENGDDDLERLLHLLQTADANSDHQVTLEEIHAVAPDFPVVLFNSLDRNHDGVLTAADMPPPGPYNPIERILQFLHDIDADHDGEVTLAEIQVVMPGFTQTDFDKLDFNHDGVLSLADLPAPSPEDDIERLMDLLHRADANGDGQVTLDEIHVLLPAFPENAFDELDRNDDGVLSSADFSDTLPRAACETVLRLIRAADANYDGQVTLDELKVVVPDVSLEQFNRLDTNDDGVLTRDDLPPFSCDDREILERILRNADANGDKQVTFDELKAIIPALTQEQFDRLDTNHDGVLTKDDIPAPPVDPLKRLIRLLHRADADENGEVTFDELLAVAPGLTQEQFDTLDTNDDGVITKDDFPKPPPHPVEHLLELLREADANHDGQVTFEELQAELPDITQERFDQLDTNDDGVLSKDDAPDGCVPPDDDSRVSLLRALIGADTNHDGQLDYAEIGVAFPDAPSDLLAQIDTNHDWVITRDEIRAALGQGHDGHDLFSLRDINADGATNALDIQHTINQALEILSDLLPADLDSNGDVDAVDIQDVILGALGLKK
ncbi:MAG: hypothetical protein HZB26_21855 [Candidatus Hydrogenedentes bacterium]|nr:hypothetical protein [Candidatus Hydrogenedentota bacterium]